MIFGLQYLFGNPKEARAAQIAREVACLRTGGFLELKRGETVEFLFEPTIPRVEEWMQPGA